MRAPVWLLPRPLIGDRHQCEVRRRAKRSRSGKEEPQPRAIAGRGKGSMPFPRPVRLMKGGARTGCRPAGGVSRRARRAAQRPEGNPAAARREGCSQNLGPWQQKARNTTASGLGSLWYPQRESASCAFGAIRTRSGRSAPFARSLQTAHWAVCLTLAPLLEFDSRPMAAKSPASTWKLGFRLLGTPNENRTRVTALKGRCPDL